MTNFFEQKSERAVTTILESRTAMFLPVKQVSKNFVFTDIEVKNNYGTVTLKDCKLTQVHRNIVDVIFSNYEPIRMLDGAVAFTFSKYDVLKELGHFTRRNTKWLETKLEDMRKASIVLLTDNSDKSIKCYQGVIREHQETILKSGNGQPLYGVVFSSNFMKMFNHDLNIHSAKLTPIILQLKNAVTQAFARASISHRKLNIDLDEILLSIGVNKSNVTDRAYRKNRKAVLDEREALEQQLGIIIKPMEKDKNKWGVFYEQHQDVWFSNPTKQKEKPGFNIKDEELV